MDRFIKEINSKGLDGLLKPVPVKGPNSLYLQGLKNDFFHLTYEPNPVFFYGEPVEEIDFEPSGAYSLYNWELFFHIPLLIATRLNQNQRFEEAMKWFHTIFDPTKAVKDTDSCRFWNFGQFGSEPPPNIQELVEALYLYLSDPDKEPLYEAFVANILNSKDYPFRPHVIAHGRQSAYMKTVVMKYIDNLLDWGDYLFRQDTMESVNEATMLYMLAAKILGPRPESIPARQRANKKLVELEEAGLDEDFSNVLIENELPEFDLSPSGNGQKAHDPVLLRTLYFCVPNNPNLLEYWSRVEDRLFKIRHCMNIEGVVRQLRLFEPPIDPAILVRAVAAGVDIGSVLNDLYAPLPYYRFNVIAQKTNELCSQLIGLGAALLAALEKKDAEALAVLRSGHEIALLKAVKDVKKQQITEAQEALRVLQKTKTLTEKRQQYYTQLVEKGLNANEQTQLDLLAASTALQMISQTLEMAASNATPTPDVYVGVLAAGMCSGGIEFQHVGGGSKVAQALQFFNRYMNMVASVMNNDGTRASIMGSHQRRAQEWEFQRQIAAKELEQVDQQIVAAEVRVAIAENELSNHDLQIENASAVDDWMRAKFTNQELYSWMVSQLSSLYFQTYQMTYDLAKQAERAFQHELGVRDTRFVQFGYWDSLKKGLLAGERLQHDVRRMEIAYLEQNRREYEITKSISLALLKPESLIKLRETGACDFDLPEWIFNLDFASHYMRRIKSVSLSIPCVTGPYTGINATLTLLSHQTRVAPNNDGASLISNVGSAQSIVTSRAVEDSGLFELNLRDERYLPFEGAGVVSKWRLELPEKFRQFDYDTISDVVFHIRYTARDGGETLKQEAEEELLNAFSKQGGLVRLFSLRHEFPNEWQRFLGPSHQMELDLDLSRFPFIFQGRTITIDKIMLFAQPRIALKVSLKVSLKDEGEGTPKPSSEELGDIPSVTWNLSHPVTADTTKGENRWSVLFDKTIDPAIFEDIGILCYYVVK